MPRIIFAIALFWSFESWSTDPKKPVSVSYQNLIRCFPELANEKLSSIVDLNLVKELSDEKFITTQSQLRQRKIQMVAPSGILFNLILRTNITSSKKMESTLTVQKIDDKGVVTEQTIPEAHKVNPKPEVINSYLVGGSIKVDEYTYYDAKLNGVSSFYRRNFKSLEEISITDSWKKRSVTCEMKKDFGVVCSCTKK